MQVGKPEEDGAAVSPATNQEDTKAAPGGTGIWHVVCDFHEMLLASQMLGCHTNVNRQYRIVR
jgi:hypothetical protein